MEVEIVLKKGVSIIDIKSGNFQTVILTSEKTVWKIEHPVPTGGFTTHV